MYEKNQVVLILMFHIRRHNVQHHRYNIHTRIVVAFINVMRFFFLVCLSYLLSVTGKTARFGSTNYNIVGTSNKLKNKGHEKKLKDGTAPPPEFVEIYDCANTMAIRYGYLLNRCLLCEESGYEYGCQLSFDYNHNVVKVSIYNQDHCDVDNGATIRTEEQITTDPNGCDGASFRAEYFGPSSTAYANLNQKFGDELRN